MRGGCSIPTILGLIVLVIVIIKYMLIALLFIGGGVLLFFIIKYVCRFAKQNNRETEFIVATILIFVITCITMLIYTNSYPYIIDEYDYSKRTAIQRKLVSDRYKHKSDSVLLFANLKFGLTANEVLDSVRINGISDDIFFNDYTKSKIKIDGIYFNVYIKYNFDDNNRLRGVVIKTKDNSFSSAIKNIYGKKYLEYGNDIISSIWLFDDLRVELSRSLYWSTSNTLELFDISNEDDMTISIFDNDFTKFSKNAVISGYHPWKSSPDKGRDSIVCLSFNNFILGGNINKKILSQNKVSKLRTEKYDNLTIYSFNSNVKISGKSYNVECCIESIDDIIGVIEVTFHTDIYHSLIIPLFESKYGDKTGGSWIYRNQGIELDYNNPQRIINGHLKKRIYTNYYDFESIVITYTDFKVNEIIKYWYTKKKKWNMLRVETIR